MKVMKNHGLVLAGILLIVNLFGQLPMATFLANANNINENTMQSNFVTIADDFGILAINGDGGDNLVNISINIYNTSNVLVETLIYPINASGDVFQGWRVEYNAISGAGNSCVNGGKDWIKFEDGNGNITYDNPDQCVKLNHLPITWLSFPTASLKYSQSYVSWSVATQLNNEKYIIEHSTDGRNFSPIGEIAGDGTTNETKQYEYIHTSPTIGINYYRIQQVDYDGKYSYSDIASVRYDGDSSINIYPNPTTSEVTITTSEQTTLQIMDVYGRLLNKQDISEGQNTINLSELPTGILIFVVGNQRYKVLKE